MNLYLRFFDKENLVASVDEAVSYLGSLPDFKMNDTILKQLTSYYAGKSNYVRKIMTDRLNYFIAIKTEVNSLDEFKEINEARVVHKFGENGGQKNFKQMIQPRSRENALKEEMPGWYEAGLVFKRVVQIPGTQKFTYKDTNFRARMTATSGEECYAKIIDYLHSREDVDARSQFPSAKSNKFDFRYIGATKAEAMADMPQG